MMSLVSIQDGLPVGWVIGNDTHDLRREVQARAFGSVDMMNLAEKLYRTEFPSVGKHMIYDDGEKITWLLVE